MEMVREPLYSVNMEFGSLKNQDSIFKVMPWVRLVYRARSVTEKKWEYTCMGKKVSTEQAWSQIGY